MQNDYEGCGMNRLEERVADQLMRGRLAAQDSVERALTGYDPNFPPTPDVIVQCVVSALEALGLKLVPVVPTEAMVSAGNDVVDDARAVDVSPDPAEIYAAMLNAVEG